MNFVFDALKYALSLPERTVRSASAAIGGASMGAAVAREAFTIASKTSSIVAAPWPGLMRPSRSSSFVSSFR